MGRLRGVIRGANKAEENVYSLDGLRLLGYTKFGKVKIFEAISLWDLL